MKGETVGSIFSVHSSNLDGTGGGGINAIRAADLLAVMAAIDPDPITQAHLMTQHSHWPKSLFQSMLFEWMRSRLKKQKLLPHSYLIKNHQTRFNAARELSIGLSEYLTRHKIKNEALSPWFNIEKSKFSRKYAPFIRECIADLEAQLGNLEQQIHERTKNNE